MSDDDDLLDRLDQVLPDSEDPLADLARLLAAETAPPTIRPLDLKGTTLAGYRLQRLLGVGGMGATYQALSDQGESVAVKVAGHLSEEAAVRFQAEAEALRQLNNPGIVGYRSHGLVKGYAYLVMDLVPGDNLQQVLDDIDDGQRTEITEKLLEGIRGDPYASSALRRRMSRILAQVADALQVCHESGVVHRDIKPANILLTPDFHPVLIDFGFSRDLFRSVSLTKSAVVMGTVGYMAPEQLRAKLEKISGRTDLFSLGLVLYRCVTGRDLRDDYSGIFAYDKKPLLLPKDVEELLPVDLQHVLYGCLEPQPENRYASAQDFAKDLRATVIGDRTLWRRPGAILRFLRSPRGRWAIRLGTLLIVLLAILLAWFKPWEPETCFLTLDFLHDRTGATVMFDGIEYEAPLHEHLTTAGWHTVSYNWNSLPIEREIFLSPDRRYHRINIPNVPTDEFRPEDVVDLRSEPDSERALLRFGTGYRNNRLWVDDRLVERAGYFWVSPGLHTLEARSSDGTLVETQEVSCPKNLWTDITLLPRFLDGEHPLPGSFRRTLSSAISPLPVGVKIVVAFPLIIRRPPWRDSPVLD